MFRRRFIALCLALVPLLGAVYVSPPVAEFVVGAVDQLAPMSEAVALTPVQRAILKRGVSPVYQCNYLAGALCGAESFSRAGNATQFDSTGNLTYAPNNLLTYSNTFSNAAWILSTATLSSGVTDPLGGTNAWTLTATGAGALLFQNVTVPTSANGLFAVYVKRRTGSGTISLRQPAGAYSAVTVTGTWTQVSVVGPGNGAVNIVIQIATSGDAIDIYAATLSAVTYETSPRAADQVITTSSAYYGPRVDYDPNTLAVKGLLIEEVRTNLALQSQNFTNAAWTRSSATVSSPSATAPDGTATAQKLVENAGTVNPQVFNTSVFTVTNGANYSWTVFFKAAERSWGVVNAYDSAVHRTYFNLNTGTIGTNAAGNTASIQAVGNGWYRCQVSRAITGTSAYAQFEISSADNTPTYTGDGTSGVYIWGAQFEAGAYATSYIPTTSSSVTRAADVVQFTGAALTALQGSAFTAFVETGALAGVSAGNTGILGLSSSQTAMYVDSATQIASWNGSAGRSTTIGGGGNYTTGVVRSAIATSASGRSLVANGGAVSTDANSATPSAVTSANLGAVNGGAFPINGPVRSLAFYNQRLPDATLQAKSIVGASFAANDNETFPRYAANDNLPIIWRRAM